MKLELKRIQELKLTTVTKKIVQGRNGNNNWNDLWNWYITQVNIIAYVVCTLYSTSSQYMYVCMYIIV